MKSIATQLEALFRQALAQILGDEGRGVDPLIRMAADEKFGDYQSNVAMGLGKRLGQKPRDVAGRLVEVLNPLAAATCEPFEIAGPGFINIRLKPEWMAAQLDGVPAGGADDRLGIEPAAAPQTVVVDYSSPNIAKEMHVGHLRSTVIGDGIARILGFEGHRIIRQNHIGDWGTQFGMVILGMWHICMAEHRGDPAYVQRMLASLSEAAQGDTAAQRVLLTGLVEEHQRDLDSDPAGENLFVPFLNDIERTHRLSLEDMLPAYRFVNTVEGLVEKLSPAERYQIRNHRRNREDSYERLSNYVTTMLQVDLPENEQEKRAWKYAREITLEACDTIYGRLGVGLTRDDVCGESFYREHLKPLVERLAGEFGPGAPVEPRPGSGLPVVSVENSDGALCVFLRTADGQAVFKNQEGKPLPFIIRKSDGAFLYATTDLAAMDHRIRTLQAGRVIYVTDARQMQHFEMLFATARAMGWTLHRGKPGEVRLEHVAFGSILGEDRKPLKTRAGGTVKLAELLDEAVSRAEALIRAGEADPEKKRGFSEDEINDVAEAVGIGAVKYADLSQNRQSDYVFSWDKMLAMDGNTAPYLMYAYARIRSIYRKGATGDGDMGGGAIALVKPQERALGKRILQFVEILDSAAESLKINLITDYLYDLAGAFMKFYENCPVLAAETPELRASRLRLCDLAARTLKIGLGLLGIRAVERM